MSKRKRLDFTKEPPQKIADIPFYGYVLDEDQLAFAEAIYNPNIDIVFVNAPAGTGKDLVAIGTANIMVQFGMYDEIYYIVSPYGERKQGYIPGSQSMKSIVYAEPLFQTLASIGVNPNTAVNTEDFSAKEIGGYITFKTDTYIRGITISDGKILILDEAQNYTIAQLQKVLTRVGQNAKVIVIGHNLQCDLDKPELSGFEAYIEHFRGRERCAVCKLTTNHRGWISEWADKIGETVKTEDNK